MRSAGSLVSLLMAFLSDQVAYSAETAILKVVTSSQIQCAPLPSPVGSEVKVRNVTQLQQALKDARPKLQSTSQTESIYIQG